MTDGRRAVFLDRDGTLNRAYDRNGVSIPPDGLEQLQILPGVLDALHRLREAGFALVVVTNQPDVARGTTLRATVEQINDYLKRHLPLDAIYCCYHDDPNNCACRKPRPGMVLAAARDLDLDLAASFFVGDSWRDVGAGLAGGCTTVLIARPEAPTKSEPHPHHRVSSLSDAARIILDTSTKEPACEALRR